MRLIVSTMKDEGPFILEWVAHYLTLGFDHFIIASNDCSDGTDLILQRLAALGIVTHIDNPGPWPQGPQAAAYALAMAQPVFAQADWVLVCDADEFLDIKVGDHTLDALFAASPQATAFTFIWQLFGHNGIVAFDDTPVTAQFTRCAHPQQIHPMQSRAIKTLFRNNGAYRKISTHRPKGILPRNLRHVVWVDGNGSRLNGFEHQGWAFVGTGQGYGDRIARMNHYAVRSIESYLMKRLRGDVNTTSFHDKMEASGATYWRLHCWNNVVNQNLASRLSCLEARIGTLMADPELAQLHRGAVDYHRARIATLRQLPQFADFIEKFGDFVSDRVHLLHDNVLTEVNQAYDAATFDVRRVLTDFQITRYREMRARRLLRRWPWFAGMDALATVADDGLPDLLGRHDADVAVIAKNLPPLPGALLDGIAAARLDQEKATPNASFARFLAQASAPKCRAWLLIGGTDWQLIDTILARDEVATLMVIDPWGFRDDRLSQNDIHHDDRRLALDHAFFQTIMIYADQIKQGRLRIVRATAMSALKLLEDRSLDVVMIAGARQTDRAMRLMQRAAPKLRRNGRLLLNGYRVHQAGGRDMAAALHGFMAAAPGQRRICAVSGRYVAVELLPRLNT